MSIYFKSNYYILDIRKVMADAVCDDRGSSPSLDYNSQKPRGLGAEEEDVTKQTEGVSEQWS